MREVLRFITQMPFAIAPQARRVGAPRITVEGEAGGGQSVVRGAHLVHAVVTAEGTGFEREVHGGLGRSAGRDDGVGVQVPSGLVLDSIARERQALGAIREVADTIIDTSAFTVHDLKTHLLDNFFAVDRPNTLLVPLVSFGYKYGVPENLDVMLDVRFLPNPYFVAELKHLTGKDESVVAFLDGQSEYAAFLGKIEDLLRFLLPLYVREGKSYLRIGIGCTGGKHRSVAVTEHLAGSLTDSQVRLRVNHRDVDRE